MKLETELSRLGFAPGSHGYTLALGGGYVLRVRPDDSSYTWIALDGPGGPGAVPVMTGRPDTYSLCMTLGRLPARPDEGAFAGHPDAVRLDFGADGCYTVEAVKGGQVTFSGVFPGRGEDALSDAVDCARLMAKAAGVAVEGPSGLVECVQHPQGVRGVLGRREVLEGFPLLSVVLDGGGCAVSVDVCHSGAQMEKRREDAGGLRVVELPLSLALHSSSLLTFVRRLSDGGHGADGSGVSDVAACAGELLAGLGL